MEELLKTFLEKGELCEAAKILLKCREQGFLKLTSYLGSYFLKIFPNSVIILFEIALSEMLSNNFEKAYDIYSQVLNLKRIPNNIIHATLSNQNICIKSISNRYINYNLDIVNKIVNKAQNKIALITFTITTCKRYNLFEQTMNSFLNCCEDIEKIDKWLCIDDNSSKEDREKMKQNYPFFEFYFKTYQEKGHPQSMNIIRKKVSTPYIFHMEDDWKFFVKKPYITQCMEILNFSSDFGQCLINKNYAETEKDSEIIGGFPECTDSGQRFIVHEHCKNEEEQLQFNKKYNGGLNCAYWPYFSFRPSLFKRKVLELGEFNEKISHFELDYSYKYRNAGFISVFFESIYCLHIGRLCSERHDTTKENAYILNDEKQFFGKEEQSQGIKLNIKTFVINLDKRSDRWEKFCKQNEPKCLCYERFSAIDGSLLEPTEQLQHIFDGNDYNMREGMVGCAMSHIKLYIELVNSNYDAFCILEDDLDFVPNFKDKFLFVYDSLPKDWDLCYLGHHVWEQYKTGDFFDKTNFPNLEKWDTKTSLKFSKGGTGGYLISKKGAKNLLEFINNNGMTNGIDTIQQKSADILNIYYCKPHLIYSDCWNPNLEIDTDIQHNFKSLTIPIEKRVENEKNFYKSFGDITETYDLEFATKYIQTISSKSIMFYYGSNIQELIEKCIFPCYSLNYKVLIVVPCLTQQISNEKFFQRLKRNNKFDISQALVLKEKPKVISFSSIKHVSDAIKSFLPNNEEYPFDTIDEADFETIVLITEIVLKMSEDEIKAFVKDLCNPITNNITVQSWNNKSILKNTKYKIAFPHEDISQLNNIYTKRFINLKNTILSSNIVYIICCVRYGLYAKGKVNYLLSVLNKYNPNIKILCINGIETESRNIKLVNVKFPTEFHNDNWPVEKVKYDHEKFKPEIIPIIKSFAQNL